MMSKVKELPKDTKKSLRHWCAIAYERDLGAELSKLHELFRQWQAGSMRAVDLSDEIHQFHDGAARELYVQYVFGRGEEILLLYGAVQRGVIKTDELPSDLLKLLPRD
jgi:hypothetical protein